MHYLILTGMSGAGKTVAIRHLEDQGALCVDNLPPMMLVPFMEACQNAKQTLIAIAVDVRSGEFFDAKAVADIIEEARTAGYRIDTLFIDANDEALVNRYKETRREHPLCAEGLSLQEAIREERERLAALKETASYLIDTTLLKPRDLHRELSAMAFSASKETGLKVEVMSFGFKRGAPREADLVFDVRFLPNPFYLPELGRHTGLDQDVQDFVLGHPVTQEFLHKCMEMLAFLLPHYQQEGKRRLVVAIGCTGGAHRSVAIAETLCARLGQLGYASGVSHRDIALEQAHWAYQKGEL